jgi:hypothetical protein
VPSSARTVRLHIDDLGGDAELPVQDVLDWSALPRGDLSVRSLDEVQVFVGDRAFGATPRPDIPLVAGRYEVRVVRKDGREERRTVDVVPGRVVVKVGP